MSNPTAWRIAFLILWATIVAGCASTSSNTTYHNPDSYVVAGHRYHVLGDNTEFTQTGLASWYGRKFQGNPTASGEPYNMYAMTAAHKRLPIPTRVRVTNLNNGRQVVVRINDRGPFHGDRIIDLSYAAAKKLGMIGHGTTRVRIDALTPVAAENESVDKSEPHQTEPASTEDNTHLVLQIGAFSDIARAKDTRSRAAGAGVEPLAILPPSDSTPLYRVRAGPFATQTALQTARARLSGTGLASFRVKN